MLGRDLKVMSLMLISRTANEARTCTPLLTFIFPSWVPLLKTRFFLVALNVYKELSFFVGTALDLGEYLFNLGVPRKIFY